MTTSLIVTVLNEEETIASFLKSAFSQTKKPSEIIVVDGGSTDATASVISNFKYQISNKQKKPKIKFYIKKGNRSIGRNEGIRHAASDIILLSDAGCILEKGWVKNISEPFKDPIIDVVAGYYKAKAKTLFQKCLTPFVLAMPDKIDPNNFLPASRSMAFRKKVWKEVGGFPQEYSHNEDYVFARRLRKIGANITFAKSAIVHWLPRKNLKEAFIMFFRFAYGDSEAGILRFKVILLYVRYVLVFVFIYFAITQENIFFLLILAYGLVSYCVFAILKNYKYVKKWQAYILLPILQIIADIAVISGTSLGLVVFTMRNMYGKLN